MIISYAGKDPEQLDVSYIAGGNVKWYIHPGITLRYNHTAQYLPEERESNVYTKTYKPMFIAALVVIDKTGYNPNVLQGVNG